VSQIVVGLQVGKAFAAIPVPTSPVIRKGATGAFHDKGLVGASHHAVIPNVNTVDDLRTIWPRLSSDEKKLFDVIARAYLAAVMPDFRYRQTTASLDAQGFPFKATGRQPIDLGWRAAFPDWRPADEKGDDAQLLPTMRNGEITHLYDPKIEAKETRPPPRYTEGTLIEAMQNAWRFVDDATLRDRLKEAKGIGTPATRAEIIGGLKRQDFLIGKGKTIEPTEIGLRLFGVLKQADPALVDPGVTAELESLLDEVLVGKQDMVGAIDAVCDAAQRIIGKLKDGPPAGAAPLLGAGNDGAAGDRPPTAAMKKFAASIARQKRIKPPRGYTKSGFICRTFLQEHAPRKAPDKTTGDTGSTTTMTAPIVIAKKVDQENGAGIREAYKAGSPAVSAEIDLTQDVTLSENRKTPRGKQMPGANTPLNIPFGNKAAAQKLGARYATWGWYAPPGVDLAPFRAEGWL
jgi:DNA topoisomerase-3